MCVLACVHGFVSVFCVDRSSCAWIKKMTSRSRKIVLRETVCTSLIRLLTLVLKLHWLWRYNEHDISLGEEIDFWLLPFRRKQQELLQLQQRYWTTMVCVKQEPPYYSWCTDNERRGWYHWALAGHNYGTDTHTGNRWTRKLQSSFGSTSCQSVDVLDICPIF